MSELIVFCRIGWADHYVGKDDDTPLGGGTPWEGHAERWNFLPHNGYCYGHVEMIHDAGFNVPKVARDRFLSGDLDGVAVVWFAKNPDGGGQFVVGWYDNATVYARRQHIERPGEDLPHPYECRCRAADALVLPAPKRTFRIPFGRGCTGQSNVWYATTNEGAERIKAFWEYRRGLSD